ncbi:ATP-binding protein [Acinetobacter baumannii]|uniref:ATP-binding protein n=1 Tax=Acinetobacter calcoaceticus/baumannii complex TaxID=909768 RepID=UPI00083DBF80|nr:MULTISPECIES: ATP-binding protein [Acinetobacter calcoaceticus/baumannii complex]MCK0913888.1 ATP-binding protein [Acinetobacter pittii]MCR0005903.1 ATP-binding protein [Acinetobacter baumannii]HAV3581653.1 sensor histidine kinase [Acinetobacter baumannii]
MKSYSLKWRLVSTILAVFVILWSLVFCWLYFELEKRLQNTLDERLSASAHMVARLIHQLPVDQIVNTVNKTQHDQGSQNLIACQVSLFSSNISANHQVIAKTQGSPESLSTRKVGLSTWSENGVEWRSYVLQKGQIQVVAAERLQLRYSLLKQILQSVLVPLIITLILCIFLILWIIRVEFQPLDQIAQHLNHKKQHLSDAATDLLELKTQNIPKEIQPFVDGLLELIHDLHQSLENEKSFSAFAAHELRSPLTAIKTHVQLSQLILSQNEPTLGKIDFNLNQAEVSILRYEQLLEQLLLLSKTEIQPQHASMETTDVAQTIQHIIVELKLKYPGISKHLNISWESLSLINLPHATLAIVIKNLIENAYLHAHSTVPIQVYMDKGDLIVTDTGHGLTDAELGLMTQRFWRKSSQNAGHGLGLSLVKLLLEKYGFSIKFSHHSPHGLKASITSIS